MNLTASMKPTFWARFNLGNMIRRTARENILLSAANAQVYQRTLIEKTSTQLFAYNDESGSMYTRPALDAHYCN